MRPTTSSRRDLEVGTTYVEVFAEIHQRCSPIWRFLPFMPWKIRATASSRRSGGGHHLCRSLCWDTIAVFACTNLQVVAIQANEIDDLSICAALDPRGHEKQHHHMLTLRSNKTHHVRQESFGGGHNLLRTLCWNTLAVFMFTHLKFVAIHALKQ